MEEIAVWPAIFVIAEEHLSRALEDCIVGNLQSQTAKGLHVRKEARFVVISKAGELLASGRVENGSYGNYQLSLEAIASDSKNLPQISGNWLERFQLIPNHLLRFPVNTIVIPPNRKENQINQQWFDQVYHFALKQLSTPPSLFKSKPVESHQAQLQQPTQETTSESRQKDESEKETLFKSWIPPIISGLLEDYVRADQWEIIVADSFRALGCHVEERGQRMKGQAQPDCIARFTSPTGQVIELIIDAKAGQWEGAVSDIRAMRDYLDYAHAYSKGLFVANSLGKDTMDKLKQRRHEVKPPFAITGRDLALMIYKRLTNPDFNTWTELNRIFIWK